MHLTQVISPFTGQYRFLSNFYPVALIYDGRMWGSAEHAYQGAKNCDRGEKDWIAEAQTPGEAKRRGQQITLRKDLIVHF